MRGMPVVRGMPAIRKKTCVLGVTSCLQEQLERAEDSAGEGAAGEDIRAELELKTEECTQLEVQPPHHPPPTTHITHDLATHRNNWTPPTRPLLIWKDKWTSCN